MSSGVSVDKVASMSNVHDVAMRRAEEMFNKLDNIGSLTKPTDTSFGMRFADSLQSVAEAQNKSVQMTKDYELGKENDLAKVMVAQQVSSLGFQLALNFRNKAMSAYKDIMNMPV
jgi:flagellar hook-basal body complex protein FliE